MEKIEKYKKIVRKQLEEIAAIAPSTKEVETQVIIDEERGHYLLYSVGWENSRWIYGSFYHVDVKNDGKVWLQHDGTDLKVADQLVEKGIPRHDIVLGFQPPHARPLVEGYAVG